MVVSGCVCAHAGVVGRGGETPLGDRRQNQPMRPRPHRSERRPGNAARLPAVTTQPRRHRRIVSERLRLPLGPTRRRSCGPAFAWRRASAAARTHSCSARRPHTDARAATSTPAEQPPTRPGNTGSGQPHVRGCRCRQRSAALHTPTSKWRCARTRELSRVECPGPREYRY